ncbi:uncharacterized protein [Typha angustifolia]|uniref:uncharacterized protein isoform X1 n=1 Tax=Typha angustifolia TaxID=59011 RepID=UPI003C2EC369
MGRRPSSTTLPSLSSPLLPLLVLLLPLASLFSLSSSEQAPLREVNLENPSIRFIPSFIAGQFCERIRISGISRLNLRSYSSTRRVIFKVSEAVPERLHGTTEVCFHRNNSIGLCKCEMDEWQALQKGQWRATISPYANRYLDVKLKDKISNSFTLSIEEEFQQWRLVCLGIGFVLLLMAPIVSNWVPFYYSSSMVLGVVLVVLIILFQGMKLLPTGRKNIFYLTIYGSVLGVGSYIAHYFSTLVNSILVNFGLSEEMHNPVSIFILVGIILTGAALGYWIVRKFILSKEGGVDAGIAEFVKWTMRVIALVFVSQSTLDSLLALVAVGVCWSICYLITKWKLSRTIKLQQTPLKNGSLWQRKVRQVSANNKQAEFFSRSTRKDPGQSIWGSSSSPYAWSRSPKKGQIFTSPSMKMINQYEDYYSSYHKMPKRKFSKKDWEDFTRESTREALTDWASTTEVAEWLADNAHRLRVDRDSSSDESMASSSGSSEETAVENCNALSLLKWY